MMNTLLTPLILLTLLTLPTLMCRHKIEPRAPLTADMMNTLRPQVEAAVRQLSPQTLGQAYQVSMLNS
jgi:hypothetical protein